MSEKPKNATLEKETSGKDVSADAAPIPREVVDTKFNQYVTKLYQGFQQIYVDQLNSSRYLEGNFENPSYLYRRYGGRNCVNLPTQEIISIETSKDSEYWSSSLLYQNECSKQSGNISGAFGANSAESDLIFLQNNMQNNQYNFQEMKQEYVKNKINNFVPLRTSRIIHTFSRHFFNMIAHEHRDRKNIRLYRMVLI